jgi:Na+/H+-dicarboxylate symporter
MDKIRMVMKTDFSTKFHQMGFWILIALVAGIIIGNFYSERIISKRLNDSVVYKAIKIDGREYNLTERI